MNTGAAILDFGDEFGPNAVGKPMRNDGPDLSANNLRANKVTPYNKVDHAGSPDQYDTPSPLTSADGATTNTQ